MSEYESKSLDALFSSSPEVVQDEVKTDLPQTQEEATTEAVNADEVNQEQSVEGANPSEEPEDQSEPANELEERLEQLEKRQKETRNWGNEQRRTALAAMKKLRELGELSEEDELTLESLEKDENPLKEAEQDFFTRYNHVSSYLKSEGENPDELLKAFNFVAQTDPTLQERFLETPADERVAFAVKIAKESMDTYNLVQETGSVAAAMKQLREQAKKEALEGVKQDATPELKPKDRTRNTTGSNTPKTDVYQRKSLDALFNN